MNKSETVRLKVIVVDYDEISRLFIETYLKELGHIVELASDGFIALNSIKQHSFDLAIIEVQLPGLDGITLADKAHEIEPEMLVVFMSGANKCETVIKAFRHKAVDFLLKPFKKVELNAVLDKCIKGFNRLKNFTPPGFTSDDWQVRHDFPYAIDEEQELVGNSPEMDKIREQIRLAVNSQCDTILIQGETGTGKEIVASQIHRLSRQSSHNNIPFIAVSCPTLPDTLFENELFGHERGSFTGAFEKKMGLFQLADNGTLFLDEISEIPLNLQAKLLRALETRKIRTVGGRKESSINVRIIAASNASLEDLVKKRRFRSDLFYRLNIFSIDLLPLRQHPQDIIPLAEYFLNVFAESEEMKKNGFSDQAKKILLSYDFPGNVRELQNMVKRSIIRCPDGPILPEQLGITEDIEKNNHTINGTLDKNNEYNTILETLEAVRWNRKEAAKRLGIPYSTFRFKMMKLGIQ